MSDPVTRLNAALEGRYVIERELGEGGMAGEALRDRIDREKQLTGREGPGQNSQVRPNDGRTGNSVSPLFGITLPDGSSTL